MAHSKRLQKELMQLTSADSEFFRDVQADDDNILHWRVTLLPPAAPYDKGAFEIDLTFPPEYPFKPPKITFRTSIYHPNINESGQICLPIVETANWKPDTKVAQVLESLIQRIQEPDPDHALREEVGNMYSQDRAKFNKTAEEHTKKNALPR
eukprot:m.50988 g.50988  ORF g.50988 m.50988 type:complete len:152 (+) comp6578_c0_seq1:155-610(+)